MSQINKFRYNRIVYTEKELIEGLIKSENWAMEALYKTQFPIIKKMVFKHGNRFIDPQDIFQDGLIGLMLKLKTGKIIEKTVAQYLYGICRNIFFSHLSKFKKPLLPNPDYDNDDDENYYEKLNLINKLKSQLKKECQDIIDIRFKLSKTNLDAPASHKLLKHNEAAQKLGVKTDNARQMFRRCMKKLRYLIDNDPGYKKLIDKP
ncbi:MAG: sigma-70 family RNA polymerase sigma factor [Bacteroidales bacterium]|jgi:RNA polymerase sigma factor (sigma-70 family)